MFLYIIVRNPNKLKEVKMTATEILKKEHRMIEKVLSILEKAIANGRIPEDAEQFVDFIKTFVDRCHHSKEEGMLFVEIEKAGIPKEGGPVGVMLIEHDQGRNYVKGMASAIENNNDKEFVENARDFIDLLRQHINKEDNILYMIADAHLSPDVQNELLERFERYEKEEMGEGVHEKYHNLVHKLEEKYS